IFDLDRTLIAGPSATVFANSLRAAGINQRRVPGSEAVAASYQALGETMLTAAAARLAARATSGWSVELVRAAAEAAADELMTIVQPYAPGVIAEHRQAGRVLVMATTSPAALVTPFAERLGMDAVVATRWSTRGGDYTGELDGDIVWGRGKLDAVRAWAADEQIDLASSWAYSDSYYDAPLLAAVGNPVAVNPDLRLSGLARLKGWPVRHLDLPEGVPKLAGRELQDWTRFLQRPELLANVRLDIAGVERIPRNGAVIAVFNHRSYFDATVVGAVLGMTGRSFRFLGKKEVFDAPLIGMFSRMAGGIRVNRSTGSNEPLDQAVKVLQAGEAIALAPEGTIPRGPAFFATELQGRWGAARLAAATGAPVLPVGLWGTEKVWPRNARLPRLSLTDRPEIRVRVGDPVPLKRRSFDADTKRIMQALVDLLPDEARVAHTPTDAELAATYPPGYRGDPRREAVRRPGTDT
ncbi:MAG: putative acyltransferase, partial [Ilumatobacteraceae bacterium]|nr:putative acyltransferase [Ilumatobacteraceae bacterium]